MSDSNPPTPELVLVDRTDYSECRLHARVCYIDKYHTRDLEDCPVWRGWLLGDTPTEVECSTAGSHDTSGYPEGADEVYDAESPLSLNTSEVMNVDAVQNQGYITIDCASGVPRPPFFIARRPMGPPCRVRARIRLAVRSLWDYPDVQVVWRDFERRKNGHGDSSLENAVAARRVATRVMKLVTWFVTQTHRDVVAMRAAAREMKLPLEVHLPISFQNGNVVTHGTLMLHDADENLYCNCSLFIPEGIRSDIGGESIFRSVAHLRGAGRRPVTRTIAKVNTVHSIVPLSDCHGPHGG